MTKEYINLHNIVDEAYELVDKRIDALRGGATEMTPEFDFLKDLRGLLKMSVNFR